MFNKTEYYQLQNRISMMSDMLEKYKRGELGYIYCFNYEDSYKLYTAECSYFLYLTNKAQMEGIKLD